MFGQIIGDCCENASKPLFRELDLGRIAKPRQVVAALFVRCLLPEDTVNVLFTGQNPCQGRSIGVSGLQRFPRVWNLLQIAGDRLSAHFNFVSELTAP